MKIKSEGMKIEAYLGRKSDLRAKVEKYRDAESWTASPEVMSDHSDCG